MARSTLFLYGRSADGCNRESAQRTGIRFLNVDGAAAARLKKSYPVYDSCIIAAGTYPGQENDVSTVGVKAVLLASDSVSAEVVEELTALLFEEQQELDFALPVELITEADAAADGLPVPVPQRCRAVL